MIDLTALVQALIALLTAVVSTFVIPLLIQKNSAEKLARIATWVDVAVKAAEQLYKGDDRGAEKKAYVMQFLQQKGYTLDIAAIEALIEAAVFKLPKRLRGE